MKETEKNQAMEQLTHLVGQKLKYALKSPDMELYDFGFGEYVDIENWYGKKRKLCTHILHCLCRFKIISYINGERKVEWYDSETSSQEFHDKIQFLVGMPVKSIELNEKNDLKLNFGDYKIIFFTNKDDEESWRYFVPNLSKPHIVVSNSSIELHY